MAYIGPGGIMAYRRILILNDTMDAGHSYTPFVSNLGAIDNSSISFCVDPKLYGLVIFTGGSDVQPELYKDTSPRGMCSTNPKRDTDEIKVFNVALGNNIPMFGICRGLQFLNVMFGGKLVHHLSGHSVHEHKVFTSDDDNFMTNSLHHQMCIPPIAAEVLAWSAEKLSEEYIGDKDEPIEYIGPEVESIWFPRGQSAGVQWHPEALKSDSRGKTWAYYLARDLINCTYNGLEKLYIGQRPRVTYAT